MINNRKLSNHIVTLLCILLLHQHTALFSIQSKYPADLTYMIADCKYSKKNGLKICEVQHGALSALKGDIALNGENGIICPNLAQFFTQYAPKKWVTGLLFSPLKRSLIEQSWQTTQSFIKLIKDPAFLELATTEPDDPSCIDSYAGIVYADLDIIKKIDQYQIMYPGILFLNVPTFPYWADKYKMDLLFEKNEQLKPYKADWRLYPKNYRPNLAQQIQDDMPSELYVIKPRGEFLSTGVIVVERENLDTVLQIILQPGVMTKKSDFTDYSYWKKNSDTSFLIEKHYQSDLACFPHSLDNPSAAQANYHYDTTYRIVFVLEYNQGVMHYHSIGGYSKFPYKALEEQGSATEQRVSYWKPAFFAPIDPELFAEINMHLEHAMLLLYEVMLQA